MHVICVTYPKATSASSGQRGTDMSQSMKKLLCLSLSLSCCCSLCLYISLPTSIPLLQFAPRTCPVQLQLLLVQYFNDGNLHLALPRSHSQLPVTPLPRYGTFSRATSKFNFDYAWESPLLRFLCHKLLFNVPLVN